MSPGDWGTLGIKPTADRRAIKQAYAAQLKQTRPDQDAGKFQELRRAYEAALRAADTDTSRETAPDATRDASRGAAPTAAPSWHTPTPRNLDRSELDPPMSRAPDLRAPAQAPREPDPPPALDIEALVEAARHSSPALARQQLAAFAQVAAGDHLDSGWLLELALFRYFESHADIPLSLAAAAIDKFDWERRDHPLWQDYPAALGQLIRGVHTRNETTRLLTTGPRAFLNVERHLFNALRRPPRPLWFHVLAASPGHLRQAGALLDRWHAIVPGMFEEQLDPRSVRWWEIRVWEGGLTLHSVQFIVAVSLLPGMALTIGLLFLFNSGKTWVAITAIVTGMSLALALTATLRWLYYRARRRLTHGDWRTPAARFRSLAQAAGLTPWLRGALLVTALASSFLTNGIAELIVGVVMLALLAALAGLSNAVVMMVLAAPSTVVLQSWATRAHFAEDRLLLQFAAALAAVICAFGAINALVQRRHWGPRPARIALVATGLALLYAPLLLWKRGG